MKGRQAFKRLILQPDEIMGRRILPIKLGIPQKTLYCNKNHKLGIFISIEMN